MIYTAYNTWEFYTESGKVTLTETDLRNLIKEFPKEIKLKSYELHEFTKKAEEEELDEYAL